MGPLDLLLGKVEEFLFVIVVANQMLGGNVIEGLDRAFVPGIVQRPINPDPFANDLLTEERRGSGRGSRRSADEEKGFVRFGIAR